MMKEGPSFTHGDVAHECRRIRRLEYRAEFVPNSHKRMFAARSFADRTDASVTSNQADRPVRYEWPVESSGLGELTRNLWIGLSRSVDVVGVDVVEPELRIERTEIDRRIGRRRPERGRIRSGAFNRSIDRHGIDVWREDGIQKPGAQLIRRGGHRQNGEQNGECANHTFPVTPFRRQSVSSVRV